MNVFETYIYAPFGGQIAEQLQTKGNGTVDLEEFRVVREINFFPFSDKNTERDGTTFKLICIKTPDNRSGKIVNSMNSPFVQFHPQFMK